MTATRRLAAILAADVAGYSRLIAADEGGTPADRPGGKSAKERIVTAEEIIDRPPEMAR